MSIDRKAYLIGGGIGSLAAAAFMIRDGELRGSNITILESLPLPGGSLDAAGTAQAGYSMRGGRMFTTDNYECTWSLFKTIPSLTNTNISVYDETIAFNVRHQSHAMARLIDRHRNKVSAVSLGFSMRDRKQLLTLLDAGEEQLSSTRITDWFAAPFFESSFWHLWSSTFAFLPWHSATEFRRYLLRFMLEFTRIDTLAGVKRTVYNQYDSLIRPLQRWLEGKGVSILTGCTVTDLEGVYRDGRFVVATLTYGRAGKAEHCVVHEGDLVVLQNASMTDDSSIGSMTDAPARHHAEHSHGWRLWEHLARDQPEFGNPQAFRASIAQSCWESFTITLHTGVFFEQMRHFTGNEAGTGGLVTFKDSNWFISVVLPHQPHFLNQPDNVQVCWGYGLYPDRVGNFVPKPMEQCNGREILEELCGHLRFDPEILDGGICIPCRMPYITSMFMPRCLSDRPLPVPSVSKNLAFVSQFVEIPGDVVFTVEYSVRAAQMAVYSLLSIPKMIPPVTEHDRAIRVQFDALIKAFA